MKILVIGANGQLGSALMKAGRITHEMVSQNLEICDLQSVLSVIGFHQPNAVINCAAYTNVTKAEANPGDCFAVNARGVHNIAMACKKFNAKMVQISSDYVFDGNTYAWPYPENAKPSPIQIYGVSKLASEIITANNVEKYQIYRTSALFGPQINKTKGTFLKTVLDKVLKGESISIYAHHRISVGYTPHIAEAIFGKISQPSNGIFHTVNNDYTSWHHFATTAVKHFQNFNDLLPLISIKPIEEENQEVRRPQHSVLKNTLLPALPNWQDAVLEFLKIHYGDKLK